MSKTNRREVAKRLTQEISVTTDTDTLIRLTRQLAKVLPKQRRTRKLVERPKPIDGLKMPDGRKTLNRLVLQIEEKCKGRGGWLALKRVEKDALLAEAKATLSAEERAAIEALGTTKIV